MATLLIDVSAGELEKLIGLAVVVLNEHPNDHGFCVICGSAWPCQRAVLAAQNLAVV